METSVIIASIIGAGLIVILVAYWFISKWSKSTPTTTKTTTKETYTFGTIPSDPKWTPFWSNDPLAGSVNLGQSLADSMFAKSGIVKRVCKNCDAKHETIYYKRISSKIPENWSMYNTLINSWVDTNNKPEDFKLYSTLDDLKNDKNAWTFISMNDATVGFPRDSAPTQADAKSNQWTATNDAAKANSRTATYYVLDVSLL